MQEEDNKNMPFSLFVSYKRRQKIIDSMKEIGGKRQEGEKILNNYKKQLAERMAREKVERGQLV